MWIRPTKKQKHCQSQIISQRKNIGPVSCFHRELRNKFGNCRMKCFRPNSIALVNLSACELAPLQQVDWSARQIQTPQLHAKWIRKQRETIRSSETQVLSAGQDVTTALPPAHVLPMRENQDRNLTRYCTQHAFGIKEMHSIMLVTLSASALRSWKAIFVSVGHAPFAGVSKIPPHVQTWVSLQLCSFVVIE